VRFSPLASTRLQLIRKVVIQQLLSTGAYIKPFRNKKMIRRIFILLAVVSSTIVNAGCGGGERSMAGTVWQLTRIEGSSSEMPAESVREKELPVDSLMARLIVDGADSPLLDAELMVFTEEAWATQTVPVRVSESPDGFITLSATYQEMPMTFAAEIRRGRLVIACELPADFGWVGEEFGSGRYDSFEFSKVGRSRIEELVVEIHGIGDGR